MLGRNSGAELSLRGAFMEGGGTSNGCFQMVDIVVFAMGKAVGAARLRCNGRRGVLSCQQARSAPSRDNARLVVGRFSSSFGLA
jgi:hypothetical protein